MGLRVQLLVTLAWEQNEIVETATVLWPSGLETIIDTPAINQYHAISEVSCVLDVDHCIFCIRVLSRGVCGHYCARRV